MTYRTFQPRPVMVDTVRSPLLNQSHVRAARTQKWVGLRLYQKVCVCVGVELSQSEIEDVTLPFLSCQKYTNATL